MSLGRILVNRLFSALALRPNDEFWHQKQAQTQREKKRKARTHADISEKRIVVEKRKIIQNFAFMSFLTA